MLKVTIGSLIASTTLACAKIKVEGKGVGLLRGERKECSADERATIQLSEHNATGGRESPSNPPV